ncbi:MAG: cellulase family glycosylhydrolase [Oscillospiraceae bacterium]|nr:cellulase family glycosylhydrolase [Oscillospiraceae bacterium]
MLVSGLPVAAVAAETVEDSAEQEYICATYVYPGGFVLPDPHAVNMIIFGTGVTDANTGHYYISDEDANSVRHYFEALNGLKQQNPKIKVFISVNKFGNEFTEIAGNPAKRSAFINDCVNLVAEYDIDGLDIDWEYPNPRQSADSTELFRLLREALPEGKLLMAATESWTTTYNFAAIDPYMDYYYVMGFDYSNGDRHNANLYPSSLSNQGGVAQSIGQHIAAGATKSKLILGVPLYSKTTELPSGKNTISYDAVKRLLASGEYEERYDSDAKAYYAVKKSTGNFAISYDKPETLQLKADYAKAQGLAGMGGVLNHLDTPDQELQTSMWTSLNGALPPKPEEPKIQPKVIATLSAENWSGLLPDPSKVTTINYSVHDITGNTLSLSPENIANLNALKALKSRNPNLKIVLDIEGTDEYPLINSYTAFASSVRDVLNTQSLDGVEISWIPEAVINGQKLVLLVQAARAALPNGKSLSLRSSAMSNWWMQFYDLDALNPYIDYFNTSTFSFAWGSAPNAGWGYHDSNLSISDKSAWSTSSVRTTVDMLLTYIPREKIVVGTSLTGITYNPNRTEMTYAEVKALSGYTEKWDVLAQASYLEKGGEFISFESPQALATKCDYIKQMGLGGLSYTDWNYDDSAHTLANTVWEKLWTVSGNPAGWVSPVEKHGRLHIEGTQLKDEHGETVVLKGINIVGYTQNPGCYNDDAFDALAYDWEMNVLRAYGWLGEMGRPIDRAVMDKMYWAIDAAIERGMYIILDWHVMSPGDPFDDYYNEVDEFFAEVSAKYGNIPNIMYEIANEPNGVNWSRVKSYAEWIIPIIRQNAPDSIALVGTPGWCSEPDKVLTEGGKLAMPNIMYVVHWYSPYGGGTSVQDFINRTQTALNGGMAIYATEWGICDFTGSEYHFADADKWLAFLDANNIGWVAYMLLPGQTCGSLTTAKYEWNGTTTVQTAQNAPMPPTAIHPDGYTYWTEDQLTPAGLYYRAHMKGISYNYPENLALWVPNNGTYVSFPYRFETGNPEEFRIFRTFFSQELQVVKVESKALQILYGWDKNKSEADYLAEELPVLMSNGENVTNIPVNGKTHLYFDFYLDAAKAGTSLGSLRIYPLLNRLYDYSEFKLNPIDIKFNEGVLTADGKYRKYSIVVPMVSEEHNIAEYNDSIGFQFTIKGVNSDYAGGHYFDNIGFTNGEAISDPYYTAPTSYTITATAGQGGKIISGAGTYESGAAVTLVAEPFWTAHFDGWYEDGVKKSSNLAYTFAASKSMILEARFYYDKPANVGRFQLVSAHANGTDYYLAYPQNYNPSQKYPLVVLNHQSGGCASNFASSNWDYYMPEACFMMVPEYYIEDYNSVQYNAEADKIIAEIQYLAQNQTSPAIDSNRIYGAGVSAGGIMNFTLNQRDSSVFAGWLSYQGITNPWLSDWEADTQQKVAAAKNKPFKVLFTRGDDILLQEGEKFAPMSRFNAANNPDNRSICEMIVYDSDINHNNGAGYLMDKPENWSWLFKQSSRAFDSLTASKSGGNITWTANVSGSAPGIKYNFDVYEGVTLLASSGYQTTNSYTFTGQNDGNYHVFVSAKTNDNTVYAGYSEVPDYRTLRQNSKLAA